MADEERVVRITGLIGIREVAVVDVELALLALATKRAREALHRS